MLVGFGGAYATPEQSSGTWLSSATEWYYAEELEGPTTTAVRLLQVCFPKVYILIYSLNKRLVAFGGFSTIDSRKAIPFERCLCAHRIRWSELALAEAEVEAAAGPVTSRGALRPGRPFPLGAGLSSSRL